MAEKKKKKSNRKIHGRRVSGLKVAGTIGGVFLVIIIALVVAAVIFIKNYKPTVDDDAHFVKPTVTHGIASKFNPGLERYHLINELRYIKQNTDKMIENYLNATKPKRVDGIYNFLVLGRDKVALNTDVMMVVNFNTNDGGINIMQLPRDTYIEYGGYPNKINGTLAHFYTKAQREGAKNPWHTALKDFSDLLEVAFSVEIDYYAIIDLAAFENVVDIIGGVPIDVPEAMHYDDEFQDLHIHIEKGYQVLDGETAAGFVRFRSGYIQADIGRQNAQKIFMAALFKQIKNNFTVDTVAKLAGEVLSKVSTNMELADAVFFAKEALSLDLENINMMTVPGEAVNTHLSYYVIYRQSVLDVVNKYFNVYDKDVRDVHFDTEVLFNDSDDPKMDRVYNKDVDGYVVNNGESIDNSGIYIPRLPDEPEEEESAEETSAETDSEDTLEEETGYEDETFDGDETDSDEITEDDTSFDDTEEDTSEDETEEDSEVYEESEVYEPESEDTAEDTYTEEIQE